MYPELIIDLKALDKNTKIIKKLCDDNNISLCAVVKVYHALPECVKVIYNNGIKEFASSRISQLKIVKETVDAKTLLIRIPMISELESLVENVDTTLISEYDTMKALNDIAKNHNKVQDIIIMQDLGDLREGIIDQEKLIDVAEKVEKELPNLHLKGIGANLTCYGSIRPTEENLNKLCETKEKIEQRIGRNLEVVSGGATTSLELLINGNMPKGVNHLRVGGLFTTPIYINAFLEWDRYLKGLENVFSIKAEVIESNIKPTYPIGEIVVDGFGQIQHYDDFGDRKRVIVALGKNDVGGLLQLYPTDRKIKVIGGSSDHTIVDVNDSDIDYKVGDIITFELDYESIMFATQSRYLNVKYIK